MTIVEGSKNRSLARHYFGDQDPTGRRLEFVEGNQVFQIAGVVEDTKYKDLREETLDIVYLGNVQRMLSPAVLLPVSWRPCAPPAWSRRQHCGMNR
ncbi:MAG TPA: hypothetical protein VI636_12190 [Candidatus Angelobacter sp.]